MTKMPPAITWPATRNPCGNADCEPLSDEDVPLGWECAVPALQIDCWVAEQAEARRQPC